MKRDRQTRPRKGQSSSRDRATHWSLTDPYPLPLRKGLSRASPLRTIWEAFLLRPAMGISGLLPLLKSIHKNKHLSEFAGKTVAVDAYVWLHKGVYACAPEVATGKRTTKYVVLLSSSYIPANGQRVVR